MKTKHDTPKYGIIYHASLVGQASGKNKGRIARTLAAKAAVSLRYDCFDEERDESDDFGLENRAKVEGRLSQLEGRDMRTTSKVVREQPKVEITEARAYNADADSTAAAAAAAQLLIQTTKSPRQKKLKKRNPRKIKRRIRKKRRTRRRTRREREMTIKKIKNLLKTEEGQKGKEREKGKESKRRKRSNLESKPLHV